MASDCQRPSAMPTNRAKNTSPEVNQKVEKRPRHRVFARGSGAVFLLRALLSSDLLLLSA